jgi:hypothetical protein
MLKLFFYYFNFLFIWHKNYLITISSLSSQFVYSSNVDCRHSSETWRQPLNFLLFGLVIFIIVQYAVVPAYQVPGLNRMCQINGLEWFFDSKMFSINSACFDKLDVLKKVIIFTIVHYLYKNIYQNFFFYFDIKCWLIFMI